MSIDKMRVVGHLAAQCLDELRTIIKPGISTQDIDDYVVEFQKKHNLQNSQRGYYGFPANVCVAVNSVMCHGIPSKTEILKSGDIVGVDVTFNKDGWHGDTAFTYPVDIINGEAHNLLNTAKAALIMGLKECRPGNLISAIGQAIEPFVKSHGMTVSHDFVGHGIGRLMHMDPKVAHHGRKVAARYDTVMTPGMTFTIEPIVCFGDNKCESNGDGWTIYTKDRSLAAQYEVTVLIDNAGYEVLTPIFSKS